jgi:hypothetical protein
MFRQGLILLVEVAEKEGFEPSVRPAAPKTHISEGIHVFELL